MENRPFQVLLVQDNPSDVRLFQHMLQAAGTERFALTHVAWLEGALRSVGQQHVDLIFLDLWLPDSQGLDTFLRMHQQAPKVPIVVLASAEDKELALKAIRCGAQDYLVKGQFAGDLLARSACCAMERNRAEQELRRREEQWRTYIEEASDLIFTLDTTGTINSVNRVLCAVSGYIEDELLGRNVLDLIAPASQSGAAAALAKILSEEDVPQIEVEALTKDGHRLVLEVRGRMLYEEGQLAGTFHIARDITERKEAEEALRESENRYRQLFEAESDAVFLIDNETGHILEANWSASAMYGYSRQELLTKRNVDLSAEPEDTQRVTRTEPVIADRVVHIPLRLHRKRDGTVFPVEITGRFFVWQGRSVHIAAIRDITERKEAEEQLKTSLREKDMLLREIYHRVKNNLQVVSSLLELQSQSIQDPQIHALFQESQSRIRAIALIHEKLYRSTDLANIRAPDYFQDLVDHLLSIYGDTEQPISPILLIDDLVLGIDTAIPCGLIVNELVSNVLKHAFPPDRTHGGTVRIGLQAPDAELLVLTISDDGIGLPTDLQLDNLQTLGLQLVDVLVQQLEGTVRVDRRYGTTFTISFPVHEQAESNGA
jgi:PAS domain S-box-containing protein